MEQQRVGISAAGMGGLFVGQPVASDECKSWNAAPEERPSANLRAVLIVSRAVWASICCYLFLRMVGILSGVRGGGATELLLELNDIFDRVWCPLPTWAHIGLVIAAWALFFRVGADLVKTLRSERTCGSLAEEKRSRRRTVDLDLDESPKKATHQQKGFINDHMQSPGSWQGST